MLTSSIRPQWSAVICTVIIWTWYSSHFLNCFACAHVCNKELHRHVSLYSDMFHCTVTCFSVQWQHFIVQWHVSLHMTCSLQLLPNVHQCTVKHVTVHWCLLPNVHQCTVKQVTVHWCLLPNVHQCTVKHVAVHWCTFGNSCKLHDVGWTACFFMYLRRCLLYVLASTLLQSREGSFCLFIWNVVRFCVSVWERERACVCVCTLMGGCLMSSTGLEFQLCPLIPLFYLASLLFCPVQLLSISPSSPYSAVGPVVPSAFLKCLTVSFER